MYQVLKILILPCLLSATFGCAEPKYVREEKAAGPPTDQKLAVADCTIQFKESKLCVGWAWIVDPVGRAKGTALFKVYRENLYDKSAVPVALESLPQLIVHMPSMNHPSRPTTVTEVDVGTYLGENIVFTMVGDWEFKLQVQSGGVVVDEAVVPLIRN